MTTQSRTEALRNEWKRIYGETLPSLALSKSPVQNSWPVHVDHCFGRIILDNVIGNDGPWMNKLKAPAVQHMTSEQLEGCIALGNAIAAGRENLVDLDAKSLRLRGKSPKPAANSKRKREESNPISRGERGSGCKRRQIDIKTALSPPFKEIQDVPSIHPTRSSAIARPISPVIDSELHHLITSSDLTPFRQRVLLALCQVPVGDFTTYVAVSDHLHSSARAVGNALRNNPFAPRVPCHRVVAADRSLGGFGGEWGMQGKHAREKVKLLRGEGVVVDTAKGKVEGDVWKGFR
ncbi:MAG: hypothetical protein Q9207_002713 [Kuettlingeria erythrocarpa]